MTGDVWTREERDAVELLRLNAKRGAFDVEKRRAEGKCLGTAVGLESDAILLVWVGRRDDALAYFAAVRKLAACAREENERYIYHDVDGENTFARYVAERIIRLATWVEDTVEGDKLLPTLADVCTRMLESIRGDHLTRDTAAARDEILARLAVHLAQQKLWNDVVELERARRTDRWLDVRETLSNVASAMIDGDVTRARKQFDSWFLSRTDTTKFNRPHDPRFTPPEMVALAEVRGRHLYGVSQPLKLIASVRDPSVVTAQ